MSMILLIVLLIILFGGGLGGYYGYRQNYYGTAGFGSILGAILILVVVFFLFGHSRF